MALLDFARPRAGFGASDTLTGFVARIVGAAIHWNDLRRTRQILDQMTAEELDDIGLSRADIDRIAPR